MNGNKSEVKNEKQIINIYDIIELGLDMDTNILNIKCASVQ